MATFNLGSNPGTLDADRRMHPCTLLLTSDKASGATPSYSKLRT